ncbi:MAG: IGHMBP2 family helicase [Candidatus Nanohalobium sp.]
MNILIHGVEGRGPGDIVGAVAGETSFKPGDLGEIEIDGEKAVVEVYGDAEKLAEEIDGEKIGGEEVEASVLNEEEEEVMDYVEKFKELIEEERREEMRKHEREIRNLSGKEREDKGRAILHLRGRDQGESIEGHKVKFMRNHKGEELPDTEISVGDLAMVSKNDPLRDDNPTGTVIEKTKYSITVAFDEKPQRFVYGKNLRLDLYVNDITYQRMKEATEDMLTPGEHLKELRDIVTELEDPRVGREEVTEFFNEELNDSQREAVEKALGSSTFLIHGPPGTGKTTTAIEVIRQEIERGRSVLATADSNTAVDNILEFLLDHGVEAVRVGHPARVTPKLRENTLDAKVEEKKKYQRAEELREEAFELKDKQDDLTHPSGRWRRGMSDEQIKEAAEEGRGSRGVPEDKIKEMAEWLEIQEKVDEKFEKADELKEEAVEEVIESADVVCSTNSSAGSELMEDRVFDTVVIDEATQATEPSCLIPLTHGRKAVMAGDHKQLPPTVKSDEEELKHTLFEKLAEKHPEAKKMLEKQYRMNTEIMEFSNQEFYDGKLEAAKKVADHTLEGLDYRGEAEPVAEFIDVEGEEESLKDSTSKLNRKEATKTVELAEEMLENGLEEEQIAVITPYQDQKDLINEKLGRESLEVDTVDGFQGREKEAVIISLVRNNPQDNIGFLKDERRLNVAVTRARRKLVVLGDRDTLENHEVYRKLIAELG